MDKLRQAPAYLLEGRDTSGPGVRVTSGSPSRFCCGAAKAVLECEVPEETGARDKGTIRMVPVLCLGGRR